MTEAEESYYNTIMDYLDKIETHLTELENRVERTMEQVKEAMNGIPRNRGTVEGSL